eukprot:1830980-Rhodomonas_salina.1
MQGTIWAADEGKEGARAELRLYAEMYARFTPGMLDVERWPDTNPPTYPFWLAEMAAACQEKTAVAYEILCWLVTQPGYNDEGKDLNWLDRQWNGEEDPGGGTGDGGAAAGGAITGQTVPPASELEAEAPVATGIAGGPALMEEDARELGREVTGRDDGSSHSVDSVVDWSPRVRCKPGHGAHGLDYDKHLLLTWREGQNDPTANLESDWKP